MDHVTARLAPTAGISRERRLVALRHGAETLSDRHVHDGVSSEEHPKKLPDVLGYEMLRRHHV